MPGENIGRFYLWRDTGFTYCTQTEGTFTIRDRRETPRHGLSIITQLNEATRRDTVHGVWYSRRNIGRKLKRRVGPKIIKKYVPRRLPFNASSSLP